MTTAGTREKGEPTEVVHGAADGHEGCHAAPQVSGGTHTRSLLVAVEPLLALGPAKRGTGMEPKTGTEEREQRVRDKRQLQRREWDRNG